MYFLTFKNCVLISCYVLTILAAASQSKASNNSPTPIIGILTQEVYSDGLVSRHFPDKRYTSYIAASYVKFVEGAGGRVVPIWIGQQRAYYEDIMSKLNGVLLPGGAVWFNNTAGYGEAGAHIIDIALQLNRRGVHMPVWGTCLGMELLVYVLANQREARTDCSSKAQALPLQFVDGFEDSRLFGTASQELLDIWSTEDVTVNWHMFCYTLKTFAAMKLNAVWRVLSLNYDWNGIEFISTIEHKTYPFYGVQFHPEKNIYEFAPRRNITHSAAAVRSSQYFADFFVNEARKSKQRFGNSSEEMEKLIFNYKPEFTGALGSSYTQQYLFEVAPHAPQAELSARGGGSLAAFVSHAMALKLFVCIFCFLRLM